MIRFLFLMIRAPPGSTRTDTLFPYTTLFRSVDVPTGLLVPVIRDCDKKSIGEIADEVARTAEKARTKGLSVAEMSGGCFSLSSLGHIGGTSFSPIINAPEVGILGITRTAERFVAARSEARRVGKECVRTWRSRWSPSN